MEQPNWRREVRQRIHGVGNCDEGKNIKFFTSEQMIDAVRKLKNLETTKRRRTK